MGSGPNSEWTWAIPFPAFSGLPQVWGTGLRSRDPVPAPAPSFSSTPAVGEGLSLRLLGWLQEQDWNLAGLEGDKEALQSLYSQYVHRPGATCVKVQDTCMWGWDVDPDAGPYLGPIA